MNSQMLPRTLRALLLSAIGLVSFVCPQYIHGQTYALWTSGDPAPPVRYGIEKLKAALQAQAVRMVDVAPPNVESAADGIVVAAIPGKDARLTEILTAAGINVPSPAESLVIRKTRLRDKDAWVVAGRDDRGLMYGLLEVAQRVSWAAERGRPFSEVRDLTESPSVVERAVSVYTMHKRYFESRLFDEEYWRRYFDLLVENRFNAFVVVFGYENGGYLAPVYPYLFDVEGFPDVRVVGFTPELQKKYSAAMHRMIELAQQRGLKVTLGLWDHIYRGGVQTGGVKEADPNRRLPGVPYGLTSTNLMEYSAAAFTKFLKLFPEIDAVQFRMHNESGLKAGAEMREFWRRMYQVVKSTRPELEFNARAKDFPDELIDLALKMGVRLRITTKYWAEQMGLPFHPTHINRQNQHDRRHGYADLLRYPKRYNMHWRLWNGGTTRILLWGNPDYVRRFAESTHIYDGEGFEINEMLATKMEAQPHEAEPFQLLNPPYRFYQYEFERYWHFYQVFGRVSFNPNTSSEYWDREFKRRFGSAGVHLRDALHAASWILPRINASIFPYNKFPTTRGWAEKQRWENLPAYANAEGSDIQQFASFKEAAADEIRGTSSAKLHPRRNSEWFRRTAETVLEEVRKAENAPNADRSPEFISTTTDLRILANLALYHSVRIHAALAYALFKTSNNPAYLDSAIEHETKAIERWRKLVEAAGDVYASDLMMGWRGADLSGHWRDELPLLEKGLLALKQERVLSSATAQNAAPIPVRPIPADQEPPVLAHSPIRVVRPSQPLTITATVTDRSEIRFVRVLYRPVTQFEDFKSIEMKRTGTSNQFEAVIPASEINPMWDFMYLFETIDQYGNGKIYPDFEKETPYVTVRLDRAH